MSAETFRMLDQFKKLLPTRKTTQIRKKMIASKAYVVLT